MDDALAHQLILRLHEVVDRLEEVAQERRPVAVESFEGRSIVYCSDGSVIGESDGGWAWEELAPLPSTRRARELEDSPTPADYSPALDASERLSAVVEAAQDLRDHPENMRTPSYLLWRQKIQNLESALADLERQQEDGS